MRDQIILILVLKDTGPETNKRRDGYIHMLWTGLHAAATLHYGVDK